MGWLLMWFLAGRRQRTPDRDDLLLPGDQELLLLGGVGLAGHDGVAWIGALMVNDAVICDGLQGTIDAYFRVFAVVAHQHGERRTFPRGVMLSVTTQGSEGQIQT